jgi:hypothetical protein
MELVDPCNEWQLEGQGVLSQELKDTVIRG